MMLEQRLEWIQAVQDQIDVQLAAEQLEALMDVVGGLVLDVALQLTAQDFVAALWE